MARSNFSNAFETTLASSMGPTDLTATVATTVGGPTTPGYLVIDPGDPAKREYILFDGTFTGTTFVTTVIGNRYLAGSGAGSGITHNVGAVVRMAVLSQHFNDLWDRVDTALASTDIDTLAELNAIVTDATLDTSSATRTPTDNTVSTAKIADNAVTAGKLAATLAGLVLTGPSFAGYEEVALTTATSGTVTLDVSAHNVFTLGPTAAVTIAISNPPAAGSVTPIAIIVTNSSHAITWPGGTKFPGGVAPVLDGLTYLSGMVDSAGALTVGTAWSAVA